MSQLVVLNGSGAIARSVVSSMTKYSSVKLIDARPNRKSVYNWQRSLQGVGVKKVLARNVQSIDLGLEGATEVVYFTHDYYTMSSDKNSHLVAAAKLAKKHGVKNFVAVCPVEQDLAWSEDQESFAEKSAEAEASAIAANPNMTLLRSNLAFGPESHLVHYLSQCALVGKTPYKNLVAKDSKFEFAPIHTEDIASAVENALQGGSKGWFSLGGSQKMTLREMMDCLEESAGKTAGSTGGPLLPSIMTEFIWDFMYGTGADLNMSRLVEFYEKNPHLNLGVKPWTATQPSVSFGDYYKRNPIVEENYAHPTLPSYKLQHTD